MASHQYTPSMHEHRKLWLTLSTITTSTLIGVILLAPAAGAEQSKLSELASFNPGISTSELDSSISAMAEREKLSYDDVLGQALAEAQDSVNQSEPNSTDEFGTTSKGGEGNTNLGSGLNKGDIYHTDASTAGYSHNHVGIYYSTTRVIEAPGSDYNSGIWYSATRKYTKPIYKMTVATAQTNRNTAANYAYNNFRGISYDNSFWDNRSNGDGSLNCSELVWKAYLRTGAGYDLDSNGGWGVYPDNLKDHSKTTVYSTNS